MRNEYEVTRSIHEECKPVREALRAEVAAANARGAVQRAAEKQAREAMRAEWEARLAARSPEEVAEAEALAEARLEIEAAYEIREARWRHDGERPEGEEPELTEEELKAGREARVRVLERQRREA